MPLFDEDEEAGLEEELQDETVDETADEEAPSGPLDSLASIEELRKQLSSASSEAEKNRKVLEKIQAARLKLLEAPSTNLQIIYPKITQDKGAIHEIELLLF